ncbi:MAG: terminase [Proteobacteria bacterium]|nr:terminase [Pseudomonadota bacterium]
MAKKKKKVNERISDALNIEHEIIDVDVMNPIENKEIVRSPNPEKANIKQVHLEKDYTDVRDNLKDIIDKGNVAIDGILEVASEGETARAYEVVSQLIKTVSEANKDLIGLHKQMKDIKKEEINLHQHNTTNQSIFVGSTSELQKLVKNNVKQIENMTEEYNA